MFSRFLDWIEQKIRGVVTYISECLPVKVIRDEQGVPFLYRYQIWAWGDQGPGLCLHHFVKSDPDRGYHDHPWHHSLSFILCGGYVERIVSHPLDLSSGTAPAYTTRQRSRWHFNYLNGYTTYHRVMIGDHQDAWTLFAFGPRAKTWNMIDLQSQPKPMSLQVKDADGGWWRWARRGFKSHVLLKQPVIATVDAVLLNEARTRVVLIRRGRPPFEGFWAFPGGRIEPTDTTLLAAVQREVREETHLQHLQWQQVHAVGTNTRDPRGFTVSVIFTATVPSESLLKSGDDAVEIRWFDVSDLKTVELAFDHRAILDQVLNAVTQEESA